jgi:hypothetical protein
MELDFKIEERFQSLRRRAVQESESLAAAAYGTERSSDKPDE